MKYDLTKKLEQNKALVKLEYLINKGAAIDITEKRLKRTIPQNAYIHVCINIFAIDKGYTSREAKTVLKRECQFMYYEKDNTMFLKSIADLDTKELSDFIEFVITFSGIEGIYIMSSEEYLINQVEVERYISSHKQYL